MTAPIKKCRHAEDVEWPAGVPFSFLFPEHQATIMMTRREILQGAAAAGAATALAGCASAQAPSTPLQWRHFPAGEHGFFRAPVLLSGAKDALLVDGGFSLSDGRAVADAIKASGKNLTAIYVSQSDPDYYFSLGPIKAAFPQAKVLAASDTITAIRANVQKKLEAWGPQLKENGPQTQADIVFPETFDGPALSLEGHVINIVAAEGMANRRRDGIFRRARVDGRYPDAGVARGMDQESGRHGRARASHCGAWPYGKQWGAGCFHAFIHPRLPGCLRRGTAKGQGQRRIDRRHGAALPGGRYECGAADWRQSGQGRDEMGVMAIRNPFKQFQMGIDSRP